MMLTRAGGVLLGIFCFILYNANGREIPNYDSQPAKYTARQLANAGTLTLDAVVEAVPQLAERPGFGQARDGHWRSRYPIASAIPAAAIGWLLDALGIVDLDVLFAANVIAKLSASLAVSVAVALSYYTAAKYAGSTLAAVLVATGLGLGTGLWPVASQTLSQHDLVALALMTAVLIGASARIDTGAGALLFSAALGIAVAARFQVLPAVLVLLAFAQHRRGWRDAWAVVPLVLLVALLVAHNVTWFGHPLGGAAAMELLHGDVHAKAGSFNAQPWEGLAGLLVSPSRGLLVFSPVVLVAVLGFRTSWRMGAAHLPVWALAAAAAQTLLYSAYSVWWGGHSYGPRYMLDVLPLLVPAASLGISVLAVRPLLRAAAAAALAWSIATAATGAFCYPAERWNTLPSDVDRHHERLWDWQDPQVVRCWRTGLSPQNFRFFEPGQWPR